MATIDDIARAAYGAGFRGQALQWMTQIAMRESGGNPAAYNPNVHTGDQSWGLWQINTLGSNGPGIRNILQGLGYSGDFHDLWDPTVNAKVAFKLSSGGTNFEPWRSHSPGWEGPQGFLTNTEQYAPAAATAAMHVGFGNAAANGQWGQAITQAQAGQGSAQTKMVGWLNQQLGKPYVFGSTGPNSFDCSGLVTAMYKQLGIDIPAYSFAQATYGMSVNPDNLAPGDIVLFHGAPDAAHPSGDLGHVGVYIGGGQYIDSPHSGATVRVMPLDPNSVQVARRIVDGSGRVITGGGVTPGFSAGTQTVPIGQVSTGTMPQVNVGGTDPNAGAPAQSFTLPQHDFANVLAGEGQKVESLV